MDIKQRAGVLVTDASSEAQRGSWRLLDSHARVLLAVADQQGFRLFFGHGFGVARLSLLRLRQAWEVHLLAWFLPLGCGRGWLCIRHYYVLPLLKTVQEWGAVFLNEIAICARRQELNYFRQHASPIIDQATDHLIGDITSRCAQHLFELSRRKALDHDVLLRFLGLELLEEIRLVIIGLIFLDLFACGCCTLLKIDWLQQAFASLFHLNQPWF